MSLEKISKSGVIPIDKPEGYSSAWVVSRLKKILGVKKAGHTGTLDPFATGLMICGINKGTKLSQFFLNSSKKYLAGLHLGIKTDTQDSTGNILEEKSSSSLSQETILKVIKSFIGEQDQYPPSFSALKHKGVPLYKHAREGNFIQKPPRKIVIHSISNIEINIPFINFEVSCSSGTYIRTLSNDIGETLGCGAHLKTLRRTETNGYGIEKSYTLAELEEIKKDDLKEKIISLADSIPHIKKISVDKESEQIIKYGKPLNSLNLDFQELSGEKYIKLTDFDNNLLAIIESIPESDEKYKYCNVFIS